jgi:hypothetical protein
MVDDGAVRGKLEPLLAGVGPTLRDQEAQGKLDGRRPPGEDQEKNENKHGSSAGG